MTKTDFVNYIAVNCENVSSKKEAKHIIDTFLDAVTQAIEEGEDINLVGFGKFYVDYVEARERRNPATGEAMMVEAHKVPKFKFAKNLKDSIR